MSDAEFTLYDLKITMLRTQDGRRSFSTQAEGTYFLMQGENLIFPCSDHAFPLYALAALLPLLPAKQRETAPEDWMRTDCLVADPDPHAGLVYKIERTGKRTFRRNDVTGTPLQTTESENA